MSQKLNAFAQYVTLFFHQELQKIVKDLFLLINETNADKASQEVLVKTGEKHLYLLDRINDINRAA